MGMSAIAEVRLNIKYSDGEMVPIQLRISRPRQLPNGNWDCVTEIQGQLRSLYTAAGSTGGPVTAGTSWHALVFALRFLSKLLEAEVGHSRAALYSHGGQHPYPVHLDELFPFPRDWERPPDVGTADG
jgi:hypothetical protein